MADQRCTVATYDELLSAFLVSYPRACEIAHASNASSAEKEKERKESTSVAQWAVVYS